MVDESGFHEFKERVLSQLDDLKKGQEENREIQRATSEQVTLIRETLAGLKVKHGIMATISGGISGAVTAIAAHFTGIHK